jgi:hypothetical protein
MTQTPQQQQNPDSQTMNDKIVNNQQPPSTFASTAPYIIQNGKIYQLTSNNQLIARNLIHINQLPTGNNSLQDQQPNLSTDQHQPVSNGSMIINGKPATIKATNQILNLNTGNGRFLIKTPDSQQQQHQQIQQQQPSLKSINIIPASLGAKPTTILNKPQLQTVKNNTIIISNNRLQSLLNGGQAVNNGPAGDSSLQMLIQQQQSSNNIAQQVVTGNGNEQTTVAGKICDLTKEINLNKSEQDQFVATLMNGEHSQVQNHQQQQQPLRFKQESHVVVQQLGHQINQTYDKG